MIQSFFVGTENLLPIQLELHQRLLANRNKVLHYEIKDQQFHSIYFQLASNNDKITVESITKGGQSALKITADNLESLQKYLKFVLL